MFDQTGQSFLFDQGKFNFADGGIGPVLFRDAFTAVLTAKGVVFNSMRFVVGEDVVP